MSTFLGKIHYTLGQTQHIVARDDQGNLLEWHWSSAQSWRLANLSERVGGQKIVSDPHGYTLGQTQHIVARDDQGDLLEWHWSPEQSWRLANLSERVGGQKIVGNPKGFSFGRI